MKLLGKGGSSRVYEAFDEQKNIVVAIKRVDLSNADEAQAEGKNGVLKYWDWKFKIKETEFLQQTLLL